MDRAEIMIDLVRDYMDRENWKYEYDSSSKVIKAGVNLKCKLASVRLAMRFTDDGFTSYAIANMNADESSRANVAEYISRANYGLKNGNFEMDYRDGEIRYKVYTNYKGLNSITDDIIEDCVVIPALMFNRYGDGLAALMFGFSTPEDEIKKAEGK